MASGKVPVFASHGLVLLHLAKQPDLTIRELALSSGVSERRIVRILRDLTDAQLISVAKQGKRNVYAVNEAASGLHPSLADVNLGDIIRAVHGREPSPTVPEPATAPSLPNRLLHGFLFPLAATDSEGLLSILPLMPAFI
jgi:DNA-binding IscR family transcriptional regulator